MAHRTVVFWCHESHLYCFIFTCFFLLSHLLKPFFFFFSCFNYFSPFSVSLSTSQCSSSCRAERCDWLTMSSHPHELLSSTPIIVISLMFLTYPVYKSFLNPRLFSPLLLSRSYFPIRKHYTRISGSVTLPKDSRFLLVLLLLIAKIKSE